VSWARYRNVVDTNTRRGEQETEGELQSPYALDDVAPDHFLARRGQDLCQNQGKQLIQFGAIAYSEFQLTNDSGTEVRLLTANNKDCVFAIGPEFGVILPAKKFNFLARVLPEFGARNRTQGVTVVFAIGKSF
jgi:hypothetical protein